MRGDVFELRPGSDGKGHEQRGRRYGVVVQASRLAVLSAWLVVPTSTRAQPAVFRPEIEVAGRGRSLALCDGIRSIDPEQRLGRCVGYLTLDEMGGIDRALMGLLDLPAT